MLQLAEGMLVEFISQPGSYGVLEELNGAFATVRWDPGVDLGPASEFEERQHSPTGGTATDGNASRNRRARVPSQAHQQLSP